MNKLKLFIRVVSSLMLLAFVFGIVAFVKASKNGELKKLYKEESTIEKEIPPPPPPHHKIELEDFSRGIIGPPPKIEDTNAVISKEPQKFRKNTKKQSNNKIATQKKSFIQPIKNAKKKNLKVISIKSFSRGSLEIIPVQKKAT